MERGAITVEVVRCLIDSQFPQWAGLAVEPVALDGWDNRTFRLGAELSVRLPSHDHYVRQVAKEHRWLPVLAPRLPLPIPEPVALGRPGCGFPRPWSVYRWLAGEVAVGRVGDPVALAVDVARFLRALQACDAADGPAPTEYGDRGCAVSYWDGEVRAATDDAAVLRAWDESMAAEPWDGPPVWVHGDVVPSNLLVDGAGRLAAVIDFGSCAVGDPACDAAFGWTALAGAARSAFREALGCDEGTWLRGRGWALWKALVTLAHDEPGAWRRFGWRADPAAVIADVVAESRP